MNNPIEDLGNLMQMQMKKVVGANAGITLELGTIGPNLSLIVASLGNAIPKGDYMVPLHLTISKMELETSEEELETESVELSTMPADSHAHLINAHMHNIEAHKHTVELPKQLRRLKAGDRVLVAWVGTEPVIVDIVVSS